MAPKPQACSGFGAVTEYILQVIVNNDGFKWHVDEGAHDQLGPSHEDEVTPLVLGLIPEGGVFVDVGAHVGHYTLRAARIAAKVVAVEPNPDTAARLRLNIAENQLTNVHVVEAAAWHGAGRFRIVKIHEQYERDGSNRMMPDPRGEVWGGRLDDILSQHPLRSDRIDVIKIDTEGADCEAISGLDSLITRHRPVLFVEDHSIYGYYERASLLGLLDYHSYEWEEITTGGCWFLARPMPAPSSP